MSQPIGYYVSGAIPENVQDSIAFISKKETEPMYFDLLAGAKDIRIPAAFDQEDTDWIYALEGEQRRGFLLYLSNLLHG